MKTKDLTFMEAIEAKDNNTKIIYRSMSYNEIGCELVIDDDIPKLKTSKGNKNVPTGCILTNDWEIVEPKQTLWDKLNKNVQWQNPKKTVERHIKEALTEYFKVINKIIDDVDNSDFEIRRRKEIFGEELLK